MATLEDIYDIVNKAIDLAFAEEKYALKLYDYLQAEKFTRDQVTNFMNSNLKIAMDHQIEEIDVYLEGGQKAAFVREAYNWMGKPRARKVRDYLNTIIEDAKRYEQSRRRGRKPGSKNKKRSTTANK